MPEPIEYPRLRYVDAFPIEQDGQTYFYVRDPLEIAPSPLVMSAVDFFIIALFDGVHSRSDIKLEFSRKFGGILLPDQQLQKIIEILDENYYLDTVHFREQTDRVVAEFRNSAIRKAWHAGGSYDADPLRLREQLEGYYRHPEGAGVPNRKNGAVPQGMQLRAIMAPHIDLRVGGPCYTHAYRCLENGSEADLYIILGVAHYGGNGFFIATAKDFETPLGRVETDREFLEAWSGNAGKDLTGEEIAHRTEHSIEFQLPFLQHVLKHPFKILPVLCGSVQPLLQPDSSSKEAAEITASIAALKSTIIEQGKRAIFILSVDLAHVGPKFGDAQPVTESDAQRIRDADYKMFEILARLDGKSFYQLIEEDLLPRRVDACAAAATLLSVMEKGEGKVVAYGQNFQPDTRSMVSYGSMAFYEPV
ncbi:MAG: AmmeMemoRadiSam system protein B [Calditrichaceae bacterium]|nr:AmmeMemoRadiSam system protein B [Calditrichia bacterium]NUQ42650.1 AmmeMemoRadiSam system protein B [Calditrichaceae bacterium]